MDDSMLTTSDLWVISFENVQGMCQVTLSFSPWNSGMCCIRTLVMIDIPYSGFLSRTLSNTLKI